MATIIEKVMGTARKLGKREFVAKLAAMKILGSHQFRTYLASAWELARANNLHRRGSQNPGRQ